MQLFGGLHVVATFGLFGLTYFLALGLGMTCEGDCESYNLWILAAAADFVGQFVLLLATIALMRRTPHGHRAWTTALLYAVISLTPTALLVRWLELYFWW